MGADLMQLPGYLQIEDTDRCVVLLDNAMTVALSRNDPTCAWRIDQECAECYCPSAGCGVTDIEDTPWHNPNVPASTEFFGLYGSLRVNQPPATTTVTATGATQTAPLKQMTFVGAVIACTSRGAVYGRQWVQDQLEPLCRPCDARRATFSLWCPDELCDYDPDDTTQAPELIEVDWTQIAGIDGCEEPEPLGPTPDPVDPFDDGRRTLADITLIPGSFQDLESEPLPTCHGVRVTFQFALRSSEVFQAPKEICVLRPPAEDEPQPCCFPLVWDLSGTDADCECPVDCACAPEPEPDCTLRANTLPDGAAECNYSTPLCARTYACLSAPFSTPNAVPEIQLTAGLQPIRNAMVTIWDAVAGLPNPSTPEGLAVYSEREPVTPPALIAYVPPQATLTLDGLLGRETVLCPGQLEPVAADVVECGGTKYTHPTLCCGRRYWIALEVECCDHETSQFDWELRTRINGVGRL